MTDEALVRSGMIGEGNITMGALLEVTTISTDPGSCIASTRIENKRLFPRFLDAPYHINELDRERWRLEFGGLEWDYSDNR
jgi:hypothetical protein